MDVISCVRDLFVNNNPGLVCGMYKYQGEAISVVLFANTYYVIFLTFETYIIIDITCLSEN